MTITDIRDTLTKLDPTGETMVKEEPDAQVRVYFGGYEDDAFIFDADDLRAVLAALPKGCPIAEGEDGSLWEVLLEFDDYGRDRAIAYAREHHGVVR